MTRRHGHICDDIEIDWRNIDADEMQRLKLEDRSLSCTLNLEHEHPAHLNITTSACTATSNQCSSLCKRRDRPATQTFRYSWQHVRQHSAALVACLLWILAFEETHFK